MKEYKTYVFDLDGTLLDTLEGLALSVNYALRQASMPERTIDEVRGFVGNGVRKLIERAVPAGTSVEDTERTLAVFRQHYMVHSAESTKPYDGIVDMLKQLRNRGKRVGVVSNKFHAATVDLCSSCFGDLVEVAVGESEQVKRKPCADGLLKVVAELGGDMAAAVYIGDSDVDIQTARNAGLECISVLWGFRDKDFLLANGATVLAGEPMDILAW